MNSLEQQDKMIQMLFVPVWKQCCLLCTGFLGVGYTPFGPDWLFAILEFASDSYSLRLLRMEKKAKQKYILLVLHHWKSFSSIQVLLQKCEDITKWAEAAKMETAQEVP